VIGHLCLIDFILFRHIKENGLEPEMGSRVCLCVGKVLGTPQHPFKKRLLPFECSLMFAEPRFVGFIYVQMSRFPSRY
jgi:hypothetical protein